MTSITFMVDIDAGFPNQILVVGSHPRIGAWNPSLGLLLHCNDTSCWKGSLYLPQQHSQSLFSLEYKYYLRPLGIWEHLFPQKHHGVTISMSADRMPTSVLLLDKWTTADECKYMYTLNCPHITATRPSKPGYIRFTLQAAFPRILNRGTLCICGSCPEFGNWDPSRALPLSSSSSSSSSSINSSNISSLNTESTLHSITFDMALSTLQSVDEIEYKYILILDDQQHQQHQQQQKNLNHFNHIHEFNTRMNINYDYRNNQNLTVIWEKGENRSIELDNVDIVDGSYVRKEDGPIEDLTSPQFPHPLPNHSHSQCFLNCYIISLLFNPVFVTYLHNFPNNNNNNNNNNNIENSTDIINTLLTIEYALFQDSIEYRTHAAQRIGSFFEGFVHRSVDVGEFDHVFTSWIESQLDLNPVMFHQVIINGITHNMVHDIIHSVSMLPEILKVVVNWVEFDQITQCTVKSTPPEEFTVAERFETMESGRIVRYLLYGVIAHCGDSIDGHYVCYVRHQDGSWILFEDETSRRVSSQFATSCFGRVMWNSGGERQVPQLLFYSRI